MSKLSILLIAAMALVGGDPAKKPNKERLHISVPAESTKVYKMPSVDEIEDIKAECHKSTFIFASVYPAVPPFSVPKKDWKKILSFLSNPRVVTRPEIHKEVGLLRIYSKTGRVWSIPYYSTGDQRPLRFAINGIRCQDGNSQYDIDAGLAFSFHIRKSYERKTGHIVSKPINQ